MPRKRTLRQYQRDPTRPAYYTKRGFSHREAIKAAQVERKQRGMPGLGHALYGPGARQTRQKTTWEPGWKTLARGAAKTEEPKPKPRREPPRKIARTAHPRDVHEVLGDRGTGLGIQAESAPEEDKVVHVRVRPSGRARARREPAQKARVTYRPKPKPTRRELIPVTKKEWKKIEKAPPRERYETAKKVTGYRGPKKEFAGLSSEAITEGGKILKQTPAGVVHAAAAPVFDVADIARGKPTAKRTLGIAEATVKGTYESLRHPHRHGGAEFAATMLGFAAGGAGTIAKAGQVGRLARAGKFGEAAKTVVRPRRPGVREVEHEGFKTRGVESKSALGRAIQAQRDRTRGARYVGKQERQNRAIREAIERAPAAYLLRHRLTSPQQTALRVFAEETPIDERIAFHKQRRAATRSPTEKAQHTEKIAWLTLAKKYIDDSGDRPRWKNTKQATKLRDAYHDMEYAAGTREKLLADMDALYPGTALGRIQAPARVIGGAEHVQPTPARLGVESPQLQHARRNVDVLQDQYEAAYRKYGEVDPDVGHVYATNPIIVGLGGALKVAKEELARLETQHKRRIEPTGLVGAEDLRRGKIRVPYKSGMSPASLANHTAVAMRGLVGYGGRKPGTLTHEFKGGRLRTADFRNATTRVMAEDYLEAQKFRATTNALERYREAAHTGPPKPGDIPVRLRPTLSSKARQILERAEEGGTLSTAEKKSLGRSYEEFIKDTFPDPNALSPEELGAGEIGYINRHLLGGLDKGTVRLGAGRAGEFIEQTWDGMNSVAKLLLIYGKIGYIAPNLIGNVALNLVQQGFLALPNLANAARLSRTVGGRASAMIDELVGSGVSEAIIGERTAIERIPATIAEKLSTVTDRYTRRASWLHEARRSGYTKPSEILDLLNDPAKRDELIDVTRRAKNAAIDYDQLGPNEKAWARRLVFIYPWVKGATRYAGQFPLEHPFQTAALAQLGAQGEEKSLRDLGPVPAYMEGIFRVGGTKERPTIVDPRSAAIFQTPAELMDTAQAVASGDYTRAAPVDLLTPVLGDIGLPFLTGRDPRYGFEVDPREHAGEFFRNVPLASAIAPPKPREGAIMQRTPGQWRARFFGGGLTPSTISRGATEKRALEEKQAGWSPEKRVSYRTQRAAAAFEAELRRSKMPIFLKGKLHPQVKRAWELKEERARATADIGDSPDGATKGQLLEYQRKAYEAEIDRAVELKLRDYRTGHVLSQKEAARVKKWAAKQEKLSNFRRARRFLSDYYYGQKIISDVKREASKRYGADFRPD